MEPSFVDVFLKALISLDHSLFVALNGANYPGFLDAVFNFFSDLHRYKWFKFGLLPISLVGFLVKFRWRALKGIFILALIVASTDMVAYRLIKPTVQRVRPEQASSVPVRLRTEKTPGDYSFPSNHAANTMAGAICLSSFAPAWTPVFLGYAFLTGFSRVYLGVHFPFDVFGGWILGAVLAGFWILVLRKLSEKFSQKREM